MGTRYSSKVHSVVRRLMLPAALWGILPNFLFWGVAFWFAIDRPIFNLDYLFVGVMFSVGWRRSACIVFLVFLLLDLLSMAGLVFPFVRFQDVTYLLGLLPYAAPVWQIYAYGVVLLVVMFLCLAFSFGGKVDMGASLVLLNIGLFFYGVHVYQSAEAQTDRWYRASEKIVDSQGLSFINNRSTEFVDLFGMAGNPLVKIGFKGRTKDWADIRPENLNPKILLIIAESWGDMTDKRIQKALLAPLMERKAKFEWLQSGEQQGAIATVGAELSELCGLATHHYNLKPVTDGFSECLPWLLKKQGYVTSAIHGSVGLMYDRVYWYPRAGFDEIHFKESRDWSTHCYSFPGVCDREIASKYISNVFSGDQKRFVYWLTLNTHAIYDARDIHEDLFDCTNYGLEEASELCRMNKLHAQFFNGLAKVIDGESMHGVEILIVGDHSPRIFDATEKEMVREGIVPWVHFKIKE